MRVLFFTDELRSGGKERRLVELLMYLKNNTNYKMGLVVTESDIHYDYIKNLGIPISIIRRKFTKYDPTLFFKFYKIIHDFNPDLIHTWSKMTSIYACPSKIILKKIMIASLVADVEKGFNKFSISYLFHQINLICADKILSNSVAGLKAYGLLHNKKCRVIYNGVRTNRFVLNFERDVKKNEINITTPFVCVMVASASSRKDYDLFIEVAKGINSIRHDITFLGIGGGSLLQYFRERVKNENVPNVRFLGNQKMVEPFILCSDIGLLFSRAEGISNSIIEYMCARLPVISTDLVGGSSEVIENGKSGYLMQRDSGAIIGKICKLLDDNILRDKMGNRGLNIVREKFTIEKMGSEFMRFYDDVLFNKND